LDHAARVIPARWFDHGIIGFGRIHFERLHLHIALSIVNYRGVDGRLEHLPREQAALLAVRSEAGSIKCQHVFGREFFNIIHALAEHVFEQHRGRCLADDAALAAEVGVLDRALAVELQLYANDVAAKWIVVFMRVRGARQLATMERVLVVIEDVFLVKLFFVDGHGLKLMAKGRLRGRSPSTVLLGEQRPLVSR